MAKVTDVSKVMAEVKPQASLQDLIRQSTGELGMALPSHLSPERLVRIALTCIRLTPKLAQCTPESFLGSLFVLAQLGLEPIAGRAYLIPFNNNKKVMINGKEEWRKVMEVQAVIGYKGLSDLFYRHESALSLDMQTVHKNDDFSYQYGTGSYLHHKPCMGDRGEVIGYYAVAKMKSGGEIFRFMSKMDATEHGKKHSKTFDKKANSFYEDSPWIKDVDAMSMKTVLIQISKLLPLSVELQRAIQVDETSREYRKGIQEAIDLPVTTNWDERQEVGQESIIETTKKEEKGAETSKLTPLQTEVSSLPSEFRTPAMDNLKIVKLYSELSDEECEAIKKEANAVADLMDRQRR